MTGRSLHSGPHHKADRADRITALIGLVLFALLVILTFILASMSSGPSDMHYWMMP